MLSRSLHAAFALVGFLTATIVVLTPSRTVADDKTPITLNVWPGKAPGETVALPKEEYMPAQPGQREVKRLTNVSEPTITVYPAPKDKANGAAVVICPGGGYRILAMDLEGEEVAQWLNSIGVTGIVLKYRVPDRKEQPKRLAPLQDAQRAFSLTRNKAKEWGIDPNRIGILGFSAGGHLSANVCSNFDKRSYDTIDDVDKVSCRPDFAVLIYPAYLFEKGQLTEGLSVKADTPPTFLAHAWNDGVTPENSAEWFLALKRAKVPAEIHIYSTGGHGFGLRPSDDACSTWPKRCEEWLNAQGWLKPKSAQSTK